jgi:hypothetical protein
MKKTFLLITLFNLGFGIIGLTQSPAKKSKPSKKETEEWIKSKIIEWSAPIRKYDVNFYDKKIAIKNIPDEEIGTNIPWVYVAPLNEIRSVYFSLEKPNSNLLIMHFTIKSGEKKIYENYGGYENYVSDFQIVLNNSICNIENQKRLIKAFNNLIVLNGGKIVKEIY